MQLLFNTLLMNLLKYKQWISVNYIFQTGVRQISIGKNYIYETWVTFDHLYKDLILFFSCIKKFLVYKRYFDRFL